MNIIKLIYKAEQAATILVVLKERFVNTFLAPLVPSARLRHQSQKLLIKLLNPISHRISRKLDEWIEANIITVPNTLSFSRALLGPIFFIFQQYEVGIYRLLTILIIAALTDYLDGYLARKMNQESELGALCDAGCDKLFALGVGLSFLPNIWWWSFLMWLIIDTILAILALMVRRARQKGTYHGNTQIKANPLGKLKYNLQGIAGLCFLIGWSMVGNYALFIANLFAIGSLLRHLKPQIQNG